MIQMVKDYLVENNIALKPDASVMAISVVNSIRRLYKVVYKYPIQDE